VALIGITLSVSLSVQISVSLILPKPMNQFK